MKTDNDSLGNPSDILVTTYVTEEGLRDIIAIEFKDFWHPKLRITPLDLVITGSTVSTEHRFAHHKPFTLSIAPFRIRHNIISFHIYDISPAFQKQTILNLLKANPNLSYSYHMIHVHLQPCDFGNPFFHTLQYTKLIDHKILVGLHL
jgi:hypothetical protein